MIRANDRGHRFGDTVPSGAMPLQPAEASTDIGAEPATPPRINTTGWILLSLILLSCALVVAAGLMLARLAGWL